MAGKRGRPRKYLKKGVPHDVDHKMSVKGYYIDYNEKKTNFLYPINEGVTKESVLSMLERHKGIDTFDIVDLSYSVITNVKEESIEEWNIRY